MRRRSRLATTAPSFKFTITTGATADAAATFAGKDAWNLSKDNKAGTFQSPTVKNITQLPLTGAAGTMLFSVIGLLIAGAAVTVFVKSRSTKRSQRVSLTAAYD